MIPARNRKHLCNTGKKQISLDCKIITGFGIPATHGVFEILNIFLYINSDFVILITIRLNHE